MTITLFFIVWFILGWLWWVISGIDVFSLQCYRWWVTIAGGPLFWIFRIIVKIGESGCLEKISDLVTPKKVGDDDA